MTAGYRPLLDAFTTGDLDTLSTVERFAAVGLSLIASPAGLVDARASDLAELLGVSPAEVSAAMASLNREGLLRWSASDGCQRLTWDGDR